MSAEPLELFHPLIREWFAESYLRPTEVQARAWPLVASGRHVLAIAPTGSGKTLCAFLWAIDRLLSGAWPAGALRVLYVSPLKALNNDIRRNLLAPLRRLEERFASRGLAVPTLRVEVRSGDTPQNERQRMVRRPPEILVTTPESLNLLLASPRARGILSGVRTVILDEIHAVASTKRGTHLITAVERLVPLAGEFQRLALSATVRPPARVAAFVGGYVVEHAAARAAGGQTRAEVTYRAREVTVVEAQTAKRLELEVRYTGVEGAAGGSTGAPGVPADASIWPALAAECRRAIHAHRSTLLFTNTRRHAEKLAYLINEAEGAVLAYSHHGSLSREVRTAVEARLKRGELKAIVATSSLELGIDVGELDLVLLVQSPLSVASALQRIGRAGHAVDRVSRGVLLPLHGRDLLDAAFLAPAVLAQDIEELRPVLRPLDLLAQVILSMTGVERWDIDGLFDALRASYPYRELTRAQFDRVLDMLAGRYADSRVRELESRLSVDRLENTVQARPGALPLLYRSGGTIPDRGAFDLRAADSRAKLGELDEEFVWERRVGDTFTLGTQNWRVRRIDQRSVEVTPWGGPVNATIFWKAERGARDFAFCERVGQALERWNGRLADPALVEELQREHLLERPSAEALVAFLKRQRLATRTDLPHRHHLLLEWSTEPSAGSGLRRVILHTLWGARVNEPLALALEALQAGERGGRLELVADDDCLSALVPEEVDLGRLLARLRPSELEGLLRRSLESSGFFGARFREAAGRALLLPRSDFRRRVPLWLTRRRSKQLLEAVLGYEDFPILTETWRECLEDAFDLQSLRFVLGELERGEIRLGETRTPFPSPFAQGVSWLQTNQAVYEDDAPARAARSGLRADVIHEALASSRLRPRLEPGLAAALGRKLRRTAPGYAPRDARDLLDWLKERVVVPAPEWEQLLEAACRDHGLEAALLRAELEPRLERGTLPGGQTPAVWAREEGPRLRRLLGPERFPELLAEWLRFYEPQEPEAVRRLFGVEPERLNEALEELNEQGTVVVDVLLEGSERVQVCDTEVLESLLRLARRSRRPAFRALPLDRLPLLLAVQTGRLRGEGEGGEEAFKPVLEGLFGYPAPAESWETELLPCRLPRYTGAWLDRLLAGSELRWLGCGPRRLTFGFASDRELFVPGPGASRPEEPLLPDRRARYRFWELAQAAGLPSAEVARRLWAAAWRGELSSDSFEAVRRGIASRFTADTAGPDGPPRRTGYDRWQAGRPAGGSWFALDPEPPAPGASADAVDLEELAKDRARQLLRRYGIVFRELLERELPPLRWPAVFRALRLLELAGEITAGQFFEGLPGLQFAHPAALALLEKGLPEDALYWLNALDPASPCGLGLPGLPPRLPGTHLVYQGPRLLLTSRSRGRELEVRVPAEDALLPRALQMFADHFRKEASPWNVVRVAAVNGEAARSSPYRKPLLDFGFTEEYRALVLRPRY